MSRLSFESFDGDINEEFSRDKEFKGLRELSSKQKGTRMLLVASNTTSLRSQSWIGQQLIKDKDNVQNGMLKQTMRRKIIRERWLDSKFNKIEEEENVMDNYGKNSLSAESRGGSYGGGEVVITRPDRGRGSICLDMQKMKACKDLAVECKCPNLVDFYLFYIGP